ncbi:chitinase [Streptomyces sp. NPDC058691]|uniref:chitinase n=1 Tax=Streptomyces sp. NPDC058691 TaxID=3346601 RepID=UPI00364E80F4
MKRRTTLLMTGLVAAALAAGATHLLRGTAPKRTEGAASHGRTTHVTFLPYVDASQTSVYDMAAAVRHSGVDGFTLGFVTARGGCTPAWDGRDGIDHGPLAARIAALRAAGGTLRVSFGGADGTELASACGSTGELAAAYASVIDRYGLTRVDFDIEGKALSDASATTRRARAVARLQREAKAAGRSLTVSFTLPAMPSGLADGAESVVASAVREGVEVGAVNIMAMDYGPTYTGDMGTYATRAATAAQARVKALLGLSDADAWRALEVTPMIGVNDIEGEVFTLRDAAQLAAFAREKGLGGLSMWSADRDRGCAVAADGGTMEAVSNRCSGVGQRSMAFARALAHSGSVGGA